MRRIAGGSDMATGARQSRDKGLERVDVWNQARDLLGRTGEADSTLSIFGDREGIRPSFEALHARFARNFTGRAIPKAERPAPLHLDVALTAEQARDGVVLRIGVPVFEVCPTCQGTGRGWAMPCPLCREEGVLMYEEAVPVHIAPMLSTGTVTDVLLDGYGIANLCLRLRTFVTATPPGPLHV
jgi:DnaJ-class molecular chaperone